MKTIKTNDYNQNYGGVPAIILDLQGKATRVRFGSVIGYAMYNNKTDEQVRLMLSRAHQNKEPLAWVSLQDTILQDSKAHHKAVQQMWGSAIVIRLGEIVEYEGKHYTVDCDHNHNFKLTPTNMEGTV